MKIKYNKEDDILMVTLNDQKIQYAEQSGDMIVHFSPERQAVLLEILDASQFLRKAASELPSVVKKSILSSSSPQLIQKAK